MYVHNEIVYYTNTATHDAFLSYNTQGIMQGRIKYKIKLWKMF